ncbi:MAG TPA: cupin domain-containing protein [Acidimicrobiia bacterium]|jgi:quercetin dioxygenase-like cupin family protein
MAATRDLTIVRPGEGRSVHLGPGFGVDFKLMGIDTDGAISVVEHPFAPGAWVPPHIHTREDEYSIVIEGEIGFRSGDKELTLGAGGYITKPRNELHAMWNAGPAPARMIEIISPAGFEAYFDEAAELFLRANGAPDPQDLAELAGRYGLTFDFTWAPDLIERYGLTPRPPR